MAKNRSLGEGLQVYEREIRVYDELHGELGVNMPAHVYSAMDANPAPWLERVFVFLFEKLPIAAVTWVLNRLISLGAKSKRRYLLVMEDIDAALSARIRGDGETGISLSGLLNSADATGLRAFL